MRCDPIAPAQNGTVCASARPAGRNRRVPHIDPQVANKIRQRVGEYVFAPARRTPTSHITGSSISHAMARVLRRYSEEVGHEWPRGLCFHSLRHTWASLALVSGESAEIVRRVLGHSSLHMLERYSHVLGTELGAATDRVQGRLVADLQLQMSIATS